jgi:hypothetical protein
MDTCPFCGRKKVREISTSKGIHELFDCHNVYVNGELYDKRHMTCYETELTQLRRAVKDMGEVLKEVEKGRCCSVGKHDKGIMLHHMGPTSRAILARPLVKRVMEEVE